MGIMRKRISRTALPLVLILWGEVVVSQQPKQASTAAAPVEFSISAQPMDRALKEFASQARLQLIFATGDVTADTLAPAVFGLYLPEAALAKLLEKTSLRYKFVNANTVSIEISHSKRP